VLLSAAYSHGLENRLSATFRMPRTALDSFVSAGKFSAQVTPGLRAVTTSGHNVGGGNLWNPDAATSVSGLREQHPAADGTLRAALFDLGRPDAVTVYLYAATS
jgi:hypothetical protein